MRPVLSWLASASELVLPRACGGCGRAGTWWCDGCARAFERPARSVTVGSSGLVVGLAAPYRGAVGSALVAWKEHGVVALTTVLSVALARAIGSVADGPCVLVPAPSRPAAVRRRGADVVAALAQAASERMDERPPVVRALRHGRRVADQAGLAPELRAVNLSGALRVRAAARPVLSGRTVVLVDDVLTTGATLTEAARAVRHACPAAGRLVGATVAAAGSFGPLFPERGTG